MALLERELQSMGVLLHGDGPHVGGCAFQVVGLADEPFPRRAAQRLFGHGGIEVQPLAQGGQGFGGVAHIAPQDFLVRLRRNVEAFDGSGVEARGQGRVVEYDGGGKCRGFRSVRGLFGLARQDFVREQRP